MSSRRTLPSSLLYVLAAALAVRVALIGLGSADARRFITPDGTQYLALARDIEGGYLEPRSDLFAVGLSRTPLYPMCASLCLAMTGGSLVAVVATQALLGTLTILVTFLLGKRLVGETAAIGAATILSFDPASALYVAFIQPESLFSLLVVLSAWRWLVAIEASSTQDGMFAGVLAGLAALTRPIALLLPLGLALAAIPWLKKASRRPALVAAMLVPFFLLTGGWILRNRHYTGEAVFSTIQGVNLLYYRAAEAVALEEGVPIDVVRARLETEIGTRSATGMNGAELSRVQSELAAEILRRHPEGAARSAAHGMIRLAAGTGSTALSNLRGDPAPEALESIGERAGNAAMAGWLVLCYLSIAAGIVDLLSRRSFTPVIFCLVFAAYFVLIAAGPEANTRFRVPAMPFLAVLGGHGLAWARGVLAARRNA